MTELHIRSFPTAVEFTEGRLFARLVPYGAVTEVADLNAAGKVEQYSEGFRKGAFDRQATTTEPGVLQRVLLTHEHGGDRLGPLVGLEERDDGLYGEFRVFPSKRDDVIMMSDVGIRELSVEFFDRKGGTVVEDGVRWRTDVHLHGAALVAQGAYGTAGAGVLAMRSMDELAAEQAEEERAEAAKAAAEEAERLAAEEHQRAIDEIAEFLETAKAKQLELSQRFQSP